MSGRRPPAGRLSPRRRFLRSAVYASGAALLAACSGGDKAKETDQAASRSDGKPKELVYYHWIEPTSWNPAFTPISNTIVYSQLVFDGLTRPDDDLKPIPSLAESWQIEREGLGYTFNLRKGVKFHDGKELTAADVKFTWEVIAHPANVSGTQIYGFFSRVKGADAYRKGQAPEISGVTTPDAYTVKVEMESVYAPFISISAFQPILPKHVYGAVPVDQLDKHATASQPVGTGPFKLVEWRRSELMAFEAHQEYWGGRPKIDRLIHRIVPEVATRTAMLRTGELDMSVILLTDFEEFSKDRKFTLHEMPGLSNQYVEFKVDHPLFQDAQVRRALIHAVDREGYVKNVMLGHGKLVDSPIHPASWAYTEPKTNYDYSPDRAKALLRDAGWTPGRDGILTKDGKPFSFELATFVPAGGYVDVLQEQWRQVGVEAKINRADFPAFFGPVYLAKKFEVAGLYVITGLYTDPEYPLGGYFWSRLNRNAYNSPKADELYLGALATTDQMARKQRYADYQEQLALDAPHMWMGLANDVWAMNSKVKLPQKRSSFLLLTNIKDWDVA